VTCARCDIKFCQQFGDQPTFLDIDKVDLQHSIALIAQQCMLVLICASKPDRFMCTTVHQRMQAAERVARNSYLACFAALLYMKPQFEVARHKNNPEWNAYNPEYFLVALSIILLNSVVTNLRPCHVCDHCVHEAALKAANFAKRCSRQLHAS